jgi:hypothetical protein
LMFGESSMAEKGRFILFPHMSCEWGRNEG